MQKNIRVILSLILLILASFSVQAQTKPGYKLPAYKKFKLPDGLTIYLMEKHDVPVISMSVIIPAGAVYDGNKAGLASITANCLKCGTKSYSKNDIEKKFDFAGASLYMDGTTEYASLGSKFAVKDEDRILPILKELIVDPVFSDTGFLKEKKRTIVELDQQKESPGSVINSYWKKFYYGNHVDGNVVQGTVSSVKPITAADARAFYKTYYNPDGSAIAVVGDFNTDAMKEKLTKLFADWKKIALPDNKSSEPVAMPSTSRVLLVNKDDAHETTLIIGTTGITRNNPDYIPVQVVNTFFGGKFTSWINNELRIKSGLTYGAYTRFSYNKNNGAFIMATHTANETTKPTIDKAMEVINRLHTQPIDEETLNSAKNYMIGMSPPDYQSTDQLSDLLTNMFWYGYDESYINNFEANVNAVTVAKANEVIAKYFPKDKLQFVLIGKSSEIKPIAEKYGTVTEVQLKNDIGQGF